MGRWHRLTRRYLSLPLLLRAGLTTVAVGGAGDVIYHSFGHLGHLGGLETLSYLLHLLTFAGMALTVLGVMIEASHLPSRDPTDGVERPRSANQNKP